MAACQQSSDVWEAGHIVLTNTYFFHFSIPSPSLAEPLTTLQRYLFYNIYFIIVLWGGWVGVGVCVCMHVYVGLELNVCYQLHGPGLEIGDVQGFEISILKKAIIPFLVLQLSLLAML